MALTRSLMKSMGLTDEQIGAIIEAHTETVNGLKAERDQYKADADKLPSMQQQIDTLKGDGTDWKSRYDTEHTAYEQYKQTVATEKANATKTAAVRAALKAAGVNREAFMDLLLPRVDLASVEMEGDAVKNADGFIAPLKTSFAECFGRIETGGLPPTDPPGGGKTPEEMTDEEYYNTVFEKK